MRLNVESVSAVSSSRAALLVVASRTADRAALAAAGVPAESVAALVAEAERVAYTGDLGQSAFVASSGAFRWVAVVGTGAAAKATDFRRVGTKAIRLAEQLREPRVVIAGVQGAAPLAALAEGVHLTGYSFDRYVTKKDERPTRLTTVEIVTGDAPATVVSTALNNAEAVCAARDLANEHPGVCTPPWLAEQARAIADRYGFGVNIRGKAALEAEGFNLIMAVGRGSAEEPQLIHLTYRGEGAIKRKIALVGKGVTYDSGGYSMKPAESQLNMHLDMGGAAAVLGAAEAVGRLKPAGVEVHFIVPTVENLVSHNAYKLNEIVKSYGGQTVEIRNTDAEGRLILADALSYAVSTGVDEIIDCATLTGACVIALGQETAGVFSNDDALVGRFLDAASATDESVWRMPLTERIEEQLKNDIADMKNIGSRWGGAISASLFLKKFVADKPWIHVDLAGPAMMDAAWEYICRGGTGFGVLALAEHVRRAGA
jgi:leucyl aminopeptidase